MIENPEAVKLRMKKYRARKKALASEAELSIMMMENAEVGDAFHVVLAEYYKQKAIIPMLSRKSLKKNMLRYGVPKNEISFSKVFKITCIGDWNNDS